MRRLITFALALVLASAVQAQTLQRERHDHTIYIVAGSADQLDRFHEDVGSRWQGGRLLEKDSGRGVAHYWAFSERTAPQAREFIFGSMLSGLKLDMKAYDEKQSFPTERSELDSIAIGCGFESDPFFITPLRELQIRRVADVTQDKAECAVRKLDASAELSGLPRAPIGSETLSEERG